MSILTEVNRIKSAVSAIAQAIRGKGVTVPTTAKVGDLASYITSIKTGADIATCTINVTFSTNAGTALISATTFANGTISTVNHDFANNNSGKSISIPNVVCGSALSINTQYMVSLYWSHSQLGHRGLLGGTITVPSASGTYTAEVGVVDD